VQVEQADAMGSPQMQSTSIKGETMKKGLIVIAAIIFMLTVVPSGEAGWKVYITNSCTHGYSQKGNPPHDRGSIKFSIDGSHLFWNSVDCTIEVGAGQEGVCELPGLICPVSSSGFMTYHNSSKDLEQVSLNHVGFSGGMPACWNVSMEALYEGGICRLVKK